MSKELANDHWPPDRKRGAEPLRKQNSVYLLPSPEVERRFTSTVEVNYGHFSESEVPVKAKFSHVSFLVSSSPEAAKVPAQWGFKIGEPETFEGEGTLEVYVGDPQMTGLLLIVSPANEGSYSRALQKRGPGLHHLAIDVLDLEKYILELSGSGWLLHPGSLRSIKQLRTAYLARPGFPGLIEVQEKEKIPTADLFLDRIEIPLAKPEADLLAKLGVKTFKASEDSKTWLHHKGQRFEANQFFR